MKITIDTSLALRCTKRGCSYRGPLDRHHLRHEMMFLKVFELRGGKRYDKLLAQYEEFREYDIRYLCRGHHGEVHEAYDRIIQRHRIRTRKFLMYYSWKEAINLMHTLREAYFAWRKIEAKRSNPPSLRLPREGEKAMRL